MNVHFVLTFFDLRLVENQDDSKRLAFISFLEQDEFIGGSSHRRLSRPNEDRLLAFRGEAQEFVTKRLPWFVCYLLKDDRPMTGGGQASSEICSEVCKRATVARVFWRQE